MPAPENLPKILASHHEWRATDGAKGTRANLRGVDLTGADL